MKVERLTALSPSRGVDSGGRNPQWPRPGQLLLLTCDEASGGAVLARTAEGLSLRLAGDIASRGDLRPGDVLAARVLASGPVLELELQQAPVRAPVNGVDALNEHMAMRPDQAAMQLLLRRMPDAAALAAAWRMLARDSTTRRFGQGPAEASALWYCWGGLQVRLRAIESEHEEAPRRIPRGYRRLALVVQLASSELGPIELRVQWTARGVSLIAYVQSAQAEHFVRDRAPALAAAIAHSGLTLARLRVVQGHAPTGTHSAVYAAALPPALFRAAAEAAVVLLGCAEAGVNPANR